MRSMLLLLIACLVATGTVRGQADGTSFTLIAELRDGEYVWTDETGEVNPRLRVAPNTEATIHIQQGETSGGVPHDIQVGGGSPSERITDPGESASVAFNAPPSGTLPYVCTVHPSTMRGEIEITEDAQQESTGGNDVPAPAAALVLALLAALALARHRRAW